MFRFLHIGFQRLYLRVLQREIDEVPSHVGIIQDGNRRYARNRGVKAPDGHREGAETTEDVLNWCADLGVDELTLYAFSIENFERPDEEIEPLFDLLVRKLREFADADHVHEQGVCIHAIGDIERLPPRVRAAVEYAERRTAYNNQFRLNVALAYGGRNELLTAAKNVTEEVCDGELDLEAIDVDTIEERIYDHPVQKVDLIVRTGGDERTSNFLPWYASGNEAAVYFSTPYWPEFSRVDFLQAIRTYQAREKSWQRDRTKRAVALVRALAEFEVEEAKQVAGRLRTHLSRTDVSLPDELTQEGVADPPDSSSGTETAD